MRRIVIAIMAMSVLFSSACFVWAEEKIQEEIKKLYYKEKMIIGEIAGAQLEMIELRQKNPSNLNQALKEIKLEIRGFEAILFKVKKRRKKLQEEAKKPVKPKPKEKKQRRKVNLPINSSAWWAEIKRIKSKRLSELEAAGDERWDSISDEVAFDKVSGIFWRTCSTQMGRSYEEAKKWIKEELGDKWRLPTVKEMALLTDKSQANPALAFPHPFCNTEGLKLPIWTSISKFSSPFHMWVSSMYSGSINYLHVKGMGLIMAVSEILPE